MGRKGENLKGNIKSDTWRHMNLKVFFRNRVQGKILTHSENWQGLADVLLSPVEAEGDVRSSFTKIVGVAPVKQKTTSQDCPSEQTQHRVKHQGKDNLAHS